jgi:medium-chain acyl-[acyl-carrier-protein] hydrolase
MPSWLQAVPVFLPGHGCRAEEAALASVDEIAVALAREIVASGQLGIALFGHSMGALVAYATAVELERNHGAVLARLVVAAAGAPHWPSRLKPVQGLPDDELLEAVLAAGGVPEAIRADPGALLHLVPALRADATAIETYRPGRHVLACPVTVLTGREDGLVTLDAARRWAEVTRKPTAIRVLPGGHFFVRAAQVAGVVQSELERGRGK